MMTERGFLDCFRKRKKKAQASAEVMPGREQFTSVVDSGHRAASAI
jgi:hypothetical protein